MSQSVSAVAIKNNPPATLASFRSPAAPAAPATTGAKPATITSLNQPPRPALGLFNNAGVVAKPAVGGLAAAPSTGAATFVAGKDDVTVEIQKSDSGYDNKIYYSTDNFATKHLIGIDNQTGTVNLGKFAEGTKIEFGIQNGVNQFFRTGSAASNVDNFQHAQLSKNGDGLQIGFEDLAGGGDRDFNDAIITVRNVPPAGAANKAPTVKDTAPKDNRSGFGDGTNPGKGAGRENSPNQGTVNPNTAGPAPAPVSSPTAAVARPAPVAARPAVAPAPVPVAIKPPAVAAPAPVATRPAEPTKTPAPPATPAPAPGPASAPAAEAEKSSKVPQKAATTASVVQAAIEEALKNNRSGLGDGTNPGRGAGAVKSPNQGSANPNNANTSAKPGVKV